MHLDKGDLSTIPLDLQSAFAHVSHQRFLRKLNRESIFKGKG